MRRLTKRQELDILREIRDAGEYLNRGSSRVVFSLNDELVVKVAIDKGGFMQNMQEVRVYNRLKREDVLASIQAFGRYIVLMEKVEELDCAWEDDYDSYRWDYMDDDSIISFAKEHDYYDPYDIINYVDVVTSLEEVNGDTCDNHQLGRTEDGRIVAYDYGFVARKDSSRYLSDSLYDEFRQRTIPEFIDFVIEKYRADYKI